VYRDGLNRVEIDRLGPEHVEISNELFRRVVPRSRRLLVGQLGWELYAIDLAPAPKSLSRGSMTRTTDSRLFRVPPPRSKGCFRNFPCASWTACCLSRSKAALRELSPNSVFTKASPSRCFIVKRSTPIRCGSTLRMRTGKKASIFRRDRESRRIGQLLHATNLGARTSLVHVACQGTPRSLNV